MEDDDGREEESPSWSDNDGLSHLRIENIWSENTDGEVIPGDLCHIDIEPEMYAENENRSEENESSSHYSRESVPEVVVIGQQTSDGPDPGDYLEEDDPLGMDDHLQVEVIEIASSDETEEWSAGSDSTKKKTAAAATAATCNGKEKNGEAEGEKSSEVDENSNTEWDFYSYLVNMDADDNDGEGGSDGKHSNAKKYVCYDCGFQTNQNDKFSKHVQAAHNDEEGRKDEDLLECLKCDYQTKNKQHLKNHMRYRHNRGKAKPVFKCGQCQFQTKYRPLLTQHLKQAHVADREVKYHCCDRCPYKTKWKHHIKEHYMFHHNEGEIEWHKCPLCDYQTKWKYHIKQHLKAKHADGKEAATYSCPMPACRFQTRWKPHFQRHLRQEHGTAQASAAPVDGAVPQDGAASARQQQQQQQPHLACPHCQFAAASRMALNAHVRNQHGGAAVLQLQPEVHQCDKCGFRTRWKHHLKNHWIMKHQENAVLPVFRCSECSYESKWKHHVKIHKENKHTQLPCERCPFVAHTKLEMRQHVKTCHVVVSAPALISMGAGARLLRPPAPHAVAQWLRCSHCEYVCPWPQLMEQHRAQRHPLAPRPAPPPPPRCHHCGLHAPTRAALEQHVRQAHPASAQASPLALQIPVLLRLPSAAAAATGTSGTGGGRAFHAALSVDAERRINQAAAVVAAGGNPLANGGGGGGGGARMQLPVLLRLPSATAGLDLRGCFRMMSSLYGGGGGGPATINHHPHQQHHHHNGPRVTAPTTPTREAPVLLLRCSDCSFQTSSVDVLKLHVVTRHRTAADHTAGTPVNNGEPKREKPRDDGPQAGDDDGTTREAREEDEDDEDKRKGSPHLKCRVCGLECADVDQLVGHSRVEHGRTLVVNGGSVSLLPPEISVTPVVQQHATSRAPQQQH